MPLQTQIDSHKVFEGYLWKKGVYNTSWKRRWFVLYNDRTCSYFEKEKHSKSRSKAKGTIHLTQINRVEFVQYDDGTGDNNNHPHSMDGAVFSFKPDSPQIDDNSQHLALPKHSISLSRTPMMTPTGSEDASFYPFRSGLQSISEQEESFNVESKRQPTATSANVHARTHGVNGWTMDVSLSSGQSAVISSTQPPPEYTSISETEQQFEKEREILAKSLAELQKSTASRPPTPKRAAKAKLERSQSMRDLYSQSAPLLLPSQNQESIGTPRLSRSHSADMIRNKRMANRDRKHTKDNFNIHPRQSFIHPALAGCVLSDEDANEFINKSIISSKIKKFHYDQNRRKSSGLMSASSASTASTMDSYQTECCITPRDEFHAFQRIMNDTKLGLKCNRRYSFALISKERDFILSAESNEDLKEWMIAFNKLCQGQQVFDGHFANHDEKYFVLHRNKVLNVYKSRESMKIEQDYDLRNVLYLAFAEQQNMIQMVMPSKNKKENNTLTLVAGCASMANEWYYALSATMRKHTKLQQLYQAEVEHIHIVHNGQQFENRHIAIYKDYMVIFKSKQQLDTLATMTFFDKQIFRDYIRKEHCISIPINETTVVRKASRSHGKYAFLVSTTSSERRWYFAVSSKHTLSECLRVLRNNHQSSNAAKHRYTESQSTSPIPMVEQKDEFVEVHGDDDEEEEDLEEDEEPQVCMGSIPMFKQMAADEDELEDVEPMTIPFPMTLKLELNPSGSGSKKTMQLTPIPLINDFHSNMSNISTISNESVRTNMSILSECSYMDPAYESIHV